MEEEIKRKRKYIVLAVGCVLIIILAAFIYYNVNENNNKKEELCSSKGLQFDLVNDVCYVTKDDLANTFGIIYINGNYYIEVEVTA